jgi:hypothetical protein
VAGIEDRCPEPVLAETDACEALAEHRAVMPPGRIALAERQRVVDVAGGGVVGVALEPPARNRAYVYSVPSLTKHSSLPHGSVT